MWLVKMMVRALIATIVIEVGLAFLLGVRKRRDLLNVVLVNIMTNPVVNAVCFLVNIMRGVKLRMIALVILELMALVAEGVVYSKVLEYKKLKGFVLSLILNVCSYGLGVVFSSLIF